MASLQGPGLRLAYRLAAVGALLWGWLATPALAAALITIVEGEATVIDGARTLVAAEGLKINDEAIVRTGSRTALLRVEWADGSVADLGPDTQAMIGPTGLSTRGAKPAAVYLLRGWLKHTSPAGDTPAGALAPRIALQPAAGALVLYVGADETWLFAESGSVQLAERDAKPAAGFALKQGEVYLRAAGGRGQVSPRPTPAQMQRVPRGFRDTLPLRSAALKGRQVEPVPTPAPSYAELREWLGAEAALRKPFPKRFAARAREAAFRAGLAEELGAHPEWEPVLFPERFTKPASQPR